MINNFLTHLGHYFQWSLSLHPIFFERHAYFYSICFLSSVNKKKKNMLVFRVTSGVKTASLRQSSVPITAKPALDGLNYNSKRSSSLSSFPPPHVNVQLRSRNELSLRKGKWRLGTVYVHFPEYVVQCTRIGMLWFSFDPELRFRNTHKWWIL